MYFCIFLISLSALVNSETITKANEKSTQNNKFQTDKSAFEASDQQTRSALDQNLKTFQPLVYDYRQAQSQQRDHLRHKYAQQQQSDILNMAKILHQSLKSGRNHPSEVNPQSSIMEILNESKEIADKPSKSDSKDDSEFGHRTEIRGRKRIRIQRKPKPNKNDKDLQAQESQLINKTVKPDVNRKDSETLNQNIIYVQPNFLKQNFGLDPKIAQQILHNSPAAPTINQDQELAALNQLIGKNPKAQLEGLKNILQSNNNDLNKYHVQIIDEQQDKDHIPITEKVIDIPNLQSKPNVRVNFPEELKNNQLPSSMMMHPLKHPLEAIQAQLDDASKLNAERVLAKATQDAIAHVEAQHKAIAAVKAKAEQEALAKLALANSLPQALPLTAVIPMQTPAPPEVHTVPAQPHELPISLKLQHSVVNPEAIHHEQKVYHSLPQKSSFAPANPQILHNPHKIHYAPSRSQLVAILETDKLVSTYAHNDNVLQNQLEKDTQIRQSALNHLYSNKDKVVDQDSSSALQKPVVKSKRKYSQQPTLETKLISKDLQYASKYAFGYRIKDFKMGNDFGHEEKREGKSAKGHYHVLLPDGRLQKVEYYADDNGYHAKVTYENLGNH